jgi:hypothetical protein
MTRNAHTHTRILRLSSRSEHRVLRTAFCRVHRASDKHIIRISCIRIGSRDHPIYTYSSSTGISNNNDFRV